LVGAAPELEEGAVCVGPADVFCFGDVVVIDRFGVVVGIEDVQIALVVIGLLDRRSRRTFGAQPCFGNMVQAPLHGSSAQRCRLEPVHQSPDFAGKKRSSLAPISSAQSRLTRAGKSSGAGPWANFQKSL